MELVGPPPHPARVASAQAANARATRMRSPQTALEQEALHLMPSDIRLSISLIGYESIPRFDDAQSISFVFGRRFSGVRGKGPEGGTAGRGESWGGRSGSGAERWLI